MNVDNFLKIGHSHTMCQDYILSGTDPIPYVILADGCSSAADSDIGARLLCHTALSYLIENLKYLEQVDWFSLGTTIVTDAVHAKRSYFSTLSVECLDATLIVAYKYNKRYKVFIYGDGHVYYTTPDNTQCYYKVNFTPNAPAYLRYWINGKQQYIDNKVQMSVTSHNWINGANFLDAFTPFFLDIPEEEIKTLIVASDGVESLMFKEEELVKTKYLKMYDLIKYARQHPTITDVKCIESQLVPQVKELAFLDLFKDMIEFKLTKGPFLSRRVKKVLKEHQKNGFVNDDDLSIGCFLED